MKANLFARISRVLIPLIFFSCSSNLDFDQVKDLKLEPVFAANLAYFDVPANQLIDDGGIHAGYDARNFDIFKDKFFNNRLKRVDFDIEIENTIDRSFYLNLQLINANDEIMETIPYPVPAYTGGQNTIKYPAQVFENQRLDLLKQTVKIGFAVLIASGPPLDEDSLGSLKLRSGATAYLVIE